LSETGIRREVMKDEDKMHFDTHSNSDLQ